MYPYAEETDLTQEEVTQFLEAPATIGHDNVFDVLASSDLAGRRLDGVICPKCGTQGTLWVEKELDGAPKGTRRVMVQCSSCGESSYLEITL